VAAGQESFRVAGVKVVAAPGVTLSDAAGESLDREALRPGRRAEVKGRFEAGVLRARTIELETEESDADAHTEIEGVISEVDALGDSFQLLGLTVKVNSETEVEID
jgi:hypothetical protein